MTSSSTISSPDISTALLSLAGKSYSFASIHTMCNFSVGSPCSSCFLRCNVRPLLLMKPLPHTLHWCGRSPVWVRLWAAKSPCWLNGFPHSSHENGRSPVCVRWWICSRKTREKARLQIVQTWGFSWVWMRRCTCKRFVRNGDELVKKHFVNFALLSVFFFFSF